MASNLSFIEFVCEQVRSFGAVRYKKMFGEYMIYINEKPLLLVCDNTVYVKKLAELASVMKNAEIGVPYSGAKEHYILDVENYDLTSKVIKILDKVTKLPVKKPKKASDKK